MNASVDTSISPAQAEVNTLVANGLTALDDFRKLNQEQIDYIVAKASIAALDKHGVLAMPAVEETGRGVFEDKATKNLFACENVVRRLRVGEYALRHGLTPRGLLAKFATGQVVQYRFTIVEGWSFAELRRALAAVDGIEHTLADQDGAAVLAARRQGVLCHGLVVDPGADAYVRRIFGWRNYRVAQTAAQLPRQLGELYDRLAAR